MGLTCTSKRAQSSSDSTDGNGTRLQSQPQTPTTAPTLTRPPVRTKLAPMEVTPPGTPTLLPPPRSQLMPSSSHTQIIQESPMVSRERSTPLHENEKQNLTNDFTLTIII